jgi:hypothetical protein
MTLLTTSTSEELYPVPGMADVPTPGTGVFFLGYGCSGYLEIRPAVYLGLDIFDGKLAFAGRICPGDSGGAILDREGALIGLAVSREPSGKPIFWGEASYHFQGI